ncbi:hypothetical protein EIN_248770 [Entamoeba invadens IP1]|uniref:Uncharacterized protein n=1 Tax=Entamoeba invadens IP1 TaxID=370355 RepID=A0A0A1UEF1_ENTIV|nr:hypothetical protein EIN_248770 [Entamoeba invadens IP1]ELP94863.1 hypothetical protein EIN_248770 [Entamoeba invadens IP1]|eukprot:XP_004261634.1 hypothetical protein EIN_248770 [Entamoeba invadens IP1]
MSLTLERQTSSSTETLNDKEICVVVKQSIFTLTITSPHRIDGTIECELVYDLEDLKPVGFVAQNPLSFKVQQITSNTINVECKLAVLSSQHEDLLFRVHVKLLMDDTLIDSIYSKPIKSTSKADSHRKPKTLREKNPTKEQKIKKASKPKKEDDTQTTVSKRKLEMNVIKANEKLIQRISQNINKQNEKIKTLNGSITEFIAKLSQCEDAEHYQLINEALTLFSQEQMETLQEVAMIFQSVSLVQNQVEPYAPYQAYQSTTYPQYTQSQEQQPYTTFQEMNTFYAMDMDDFHYGQDSMFGTEMQRSVQSQMGGPTRKIQSSNDMYPQK